MIFAYIIKFKPITKNELVLAHDTNVWNDRDTDDFLHYLKMEFFMITYMINFIIMEIIMGFSNLFHLDYMGAREWWPVKSTFLVIIIFRGLFLAIILFCMATGRTIGSNLFIRQSHENDKNKSSICGVKIKNILNILLRLAIPSYVFYHVSTDWSLHNILCAAWLNVDMTALLVEVPLFVFLQWYIRHQVEKSKKEVIQFYIE